MARILILYYSSYGHIEQMAEAVAEGVRDAGENDVTIKRVPELVPDHVARDSNYKLDQPAAVATPEELADYDAVIFGTPTRFGNMAAQMRNFLDQTGAHWMSGALIGKVGSVFTSTATGGGNESTILTFWPTLAHQGFVIVGLPYSSEELMDISELRGGSPYGAGTVSGPDNKRFPSEKELKLARDQGRHVASITRKLAA